MVPACGPLSGINLNTRRVHKTESTKKLPDLYWIAIELQLIAQVLCYRVTFVCFELTPPSNYGLTTPSKKTQTFSSCFEKKHLEGRCVLNYVHMALGPSFYFQICYRYCTSFWMECAVSEYFSLEDGVGMLTPEVNSERFCIVPQQSTPILQ